MVCVLPPPNAVCRPITGSPPVPASRCKRRRQHALQALGQEGDAEEIFRRRVVLGRVPASTAKRSAANSASLKRLASTSGCGSATSIQGLRPCPAVSAAAGGRSSLGCGGGCGGARLRGAAANAGLPLRVIEALEFGDLSAGRLHRLQELVHGVEIAQRFVVLQRDRQMRGGVARLQRHRGEVAHPVLVVAREGLVEHLAPVVDHGLEQAVGIERARSAPTPARGWHNAASWRRGRAFMRASTKGVRPLLQMVKPVLDACAAFLSRRTSLRSRRSEQRRLAAARSIGATLLSTPGLRASAIPGRVRCRPAPPPPSPSATRSRRGGRRARGRPPPSAPSAATSLAAASPPPSSALSTRAVCCTHSQTVRCLVSRRRFQSSRQISARGAARPCPCSPETRQRRTARRAGCSWRWRA